MTRTLSAALLAAQQATQRKPAIRVSINSVDYSERLLTVEHHEEPYRDYAIIELDNSDRGLDSVSTVANNLLGYRFRIAYGYYTGAVVAEPNGDSSGNEYVDSADLWVKNQQIVSSEGQLVLKLYCEGQWMYLREQRVMAVAESVEVIDGTAYQYFEAVFNATKTIYELSELIVEAAISQPPDNVWTLSVSPSPDDGILNNFRPVYSIVIMPSAADALKELSEFTHCFIRVKANLTLEWVYPQSSDAVDETYYSYQAPWFIEYAEALNLSVPNRIVVFANNPLELNPWPATTIIGDTGAYSGNYTEVIEPALASQITTQQDADNFANAILTKVIAEQLAGYLIVYHDARVELYDRIKVYDERGI